jgi:hypothetical protein
MKLRDECIESPTIFRCSPICPTSTSEKTGRHTALGLFLTVSLPASLTVSTPCAQATLGSLLLQPLLISTNPLLHLAFQPVQFLLGDLECAGERHADEREDVGEGVDSLEKGVVECLKACKGSGGSLEVLVCTFIGGGTLWKLKRATTPKSKRRDNTPFYIHSTPLPNHPPIPFPVPTNA